MVPQVEVHAGPFTVDEVLGPPLLLVQAEVADGDTTRAVRPAAVGTDVVGQVGLPEVHTLAVRLGPPRRAIAGGEGPGLAPILAPVTALAATRLPFQEAATWEMLAPLATPLRVPAIPAGLVGAQDAVAAVGRP